MASEVELFVSGNRIAVCRSAVGSAQGRVSGRNAHRAADAVIVFDPPNNRAVATERRESNAVLCGERSLKTKPHCQRVVGIRLAWWGLGFLDGFFTQLKNAMRLI